VVTRRPTADFSQRTSPQISTFRLDAQVRSKSSNQGLAMRNHWIMTPFETAIFIGATTLMIGGFVMVGLG
jgi:hypothetical protein